MDIKWTSNGQIVGVQSTTELENQRIFGGWSGASEVYNLIIPKYSKIFQNIPKYSKIFQIIPIHSKLFQYSMVTKRGGFDPFF